MCSMPLRGRSADFPCKKTGVPGRDDVAAAGQVFDAAFIGDIYRECRFESQVSGGVGNLRIAPEFERGFAPFL